MGTNAHLIYGIPDIELRTTTGDAVNPADFCGHELLVLFLPTDPAAALTELQDYSSHADDFGRNDAFMLPVSDEDRWRPVDKAQRLAFDSKGDAWKAFAALSKSETARREDGAAFLFGRGGNLQRAWTGRGHAIDVAAEIGRRS